MSYSTGEGFVLSRVRACAGFNAANTAQSDWKLLNSGADDHYAILCPGAFTLEWVTPNVYQANWVTLIQVWQRYVDETTTHNNLYGHVNDLLALLAYRHLNSSTILDASFEGAEAPLEMANREGGISWLRWDVRVKWSEQAEVTYAD